MSAAAVLDDVAPDLTLSTPQAADALGISYRRLDYLVRSVPELRDRESMTAGSGNRRRWDLDTIHRLTVAVRITEAIGQFNDNRASTGTLWIAAAEACLAGDPPPAAGWAILTPAGGVSYHPSGPLDLRPGPVGLVIRYDEAS